MIPIIALSPSRLSVTGTPSKGVFVILRRLIFIALSAVIYVAPPAFAQAVRASYSGLSGQNLPFWLTYDAGLYKKYGLSTEIVLISGGLTNIQAVMKRTDVHPNDDLGTIRPLNHNFFVSK